MKLKKIMNVKTILMIGAAALVVGLFAWEYTYVSHAAKVKPLQHLQPNQITRKINSFESGLKPSVKMGFKELTENAQMYLIRHPKVFHKFETDHVFYTKLCDLSKWSNSFGAYGIRYVLKHPNVKLGHYNGKHNMHFVKNKKLIKKVEYVK